MRIVAGEWRGRPIASPEGRNTRPTSDRAREGLFSMLVSRIGSFEGLHVGDLFAGSGALGLEAMSRGAAHGVFVDNDREAVAAIRRNLQAFGALPRADIIAQSVEYARGRHPAPATSSSSIRLMPPASPPWRWAASPIRSGWRPAASSV